MKGAWKIESNHIVFQTENELLHPNAEELFAVVNSLPTFVPDTEKYPFLWLILLRVTHKNFLDFKGKTLDYIGREIFYY